MLTGPPNLSEAHARGKRRTQDAESDLEHLVQAIRAGDPAAVERLYEVLQGGVRFLIVRWSAPDDVDDLVHDVLLASVEAIKSGRLREPGALLGYVGRVAKNLSATRFTASVKWSGAPPRRNTVS